VKLRAPVAGMLAVVIVGFFITEYVLRSGPPTTASAAQIATLSRLARQSAVASTLLHSCSDTTCIATDWSVMTTAQERLAAYSAGLAALLGNGSCRTALTAYARFLRTGDRLAATWLASTYPLTLRGSAEFEVTYFNGHGMEEEYLTGACRLPASFRRIVI
jgi:hypothetical protein